MRLRRTALEAAGKLSLEAGLRAIPDKVVEAAIAAKPWLNAGQMDAVRTVCRGQGLTVIEGPPGSGKSTLFEVFGAAIELDKERGHAHRPHPLEPGRGANSKKAGHQVLHYRSLPL